MVQKEQVLQEEAKLKKAFTLMELVFVIIIIAIIAAVTIPKILDNSDKTQIASIVGSDIKSIYRAAGEWKKSSNAAGGSYSTISGDKISAYLPTNMSVDAGGWIYSSGLNKGIRYEILSDKINSDGDSFKVFVDLQTARDRNHWSTNIQKYAELKATDILQRTSADPTKATIDLAAKAIGDANADFTNGGTTDDSMCGTRQIAY